jgi:trimethylamine-N-oxide reductase (cytochrome c)
MGYCLKYQRAGHGACRSLCYREAYFGVVYIDHGSRFDPIDAEKIDRGGAINLITPHNNISKTATGMVVSGFLVETQKITDEEMEDLKRRYPEAFARKVDPACGVCLEG